MSNELAIKDWPAPHLLADAAKAVAAIPEGKHAALIAFAEGDAGGVDIGLMTAKRIKGDWYIVGRIDKPWHQPIKGSVSILTTW